MTRNCLNVMRKVASRSSWDPNYEDFSGTEFAFNDIEIKAKIHERLKKHYTELLRKAYKESTGKELESADKHIDPRFSYMLGRAANITPEVLAKLSKKYQERLGGWASTGFNVDPGLVLDAADNANEDKGVHPLHYKALGLRGDIPYKHGKRVLTRLVDAK